MDLDKKYEYRWTADEWNRDVDHRAACTTLCGDIAHLYEKAIRQGRVYVDGEIVMAEGKLTPLTVNLTDVSRTALLEAAKTTEHSRTDVVNRALQVYAFVVKQDGWQPALVRGNEVKRFNLE